MTTIRSRLGAAEAKDALRVLPLVLTLLGFTWFAYDRWLAVDAFLGLGIDAGNYLATMRQISGLDVSGEGLLRPPLIGYFLWPLVQIFGPLAALKIGALIVSLLHAGIFSPWLRVTSRVGLPSRRRLLSLLPSPRLRLLPGAT